MKRFYKHVSISHERDGYGIRLDGRPVKTPAKLLLKLPTRALADTVVTEWTMQSETIDPKSMPFTRHANSVIDRIAPQRATVVEEIANYGGSDVICYHATQPADLVALQVEAWQPLRDWSREILGAELRAAAGVSPIAQSEATLATFRSIVASCDDWQLAALHDAVSISGSLVIGLALSRERLTADSAWQFSHIDELFQVARWGEDSLAAVARQNKREALEVAARLFHLLRLN